MNIKIRITKYSVIMFSLISMILMTACQPEDSFKNNGLTATDIDASFTVTPVNGVTNRYTLQAQSTANVITNWWDVGDGSGMFRGKVNEEIFLPDAGTYTLSHTAVTKGGTTYMSSQELTVEESDPNSGNIVKGGKFATPEDIAQWTIGGTGSSDGVWTFANGKATLTASGYGGRGIYQAVDVIEGKTYHIDMLISSTSGVSDTWFEIYCGYSVPTTSGDYNEGGKLMTINTWAGCGGDPFSGKLSVVGCDLGAITYPNEPGKFVATATGTAYLVIRGGGNDMRDGIAITNVEMRGTN